VRIVQTNAAGDSVMLIDPVTNKVVGEIKGIEVNHGVAAAPDGSRFYITNEAESTVDVADAKTLKVDQADPADQPPEQHRCQQGRQAGLRGDRRRGRRGGRDRHGHADAREEHPHRRRHP
jgi:DNA-binding beta-propeller fold protein YncE